jgi:RNA polymerase sigma-70 factor (ECF subfamily)
MDGTMITQGPALHSHPLAGAAPAKEIPFDRQSLIASYERYHAELYRYAYRLLGDADTAEDCVGETFYRFLKAVRDGLGPLENTRAYLYRVARNWINDHYRSQPMRMTSLDIELDGDPEANPAKLAAENLERERIRAAVRSLPPDQQQVIVLRFMEDWSHEDVAAVLGRSVEATRTLQRRALISLRQYLQLEEAGFSCRRRGH